MKYLVNGREFDDVEEARSYELELEQKAQKRNKILADVIEKNVHIVKVRNNITNTIEYVAVGVDSDGVSSGSSSFPKNIAYAFIESEYGRRYSWTSTNKYIKVKENWGTEKISNDELNKVRLCIYNYLNSSERNAGHTCVIGDDCKVYFLDCLYDLVDEDVKKEPQSDIPKSFLELLDSIASGNVPSGFIRL